MLANKINTVTLHPVNKHLSSFFYRIRMHYNKLDGNILKTLIKRNNICIFYCINLEGYCNVK